MRSDAPGWTAFWSKYDDGSWEPDTKAWIQQLNPGDLFVDIGAWIGPVTLWALERGAQVIAVEPDPAALERLALNLGLEFSDPEHGKLIIHGDHQVTVWLGAITVNGGKVNIDRSNGDSCTKITKNLMDTRDGIEVESWTIQDILGDKTPKAVKIDVEGYERLLVPAICPYLGEIGANVQVSCHGEIPDPRSFRNHARIEWPDNSWGDIRAYAN